MPRKNPRRNISRIDLVTSAGNPCGGWEVRIQRRARKHQKFFADRQYGGRRAALQAAKLYRDDLEQRLRPMTVVEQARVPGPRNTSGIVGVRRAVKTEESEQYIYTYTFWVAQWTDGKGKRKTRSFSVEKYGETEAYEKAVNARMKGIAQAKRTL